MSAPIHISAHAIDRYLERLDPRATREEAREKLEKLVSGGVGSEVRGAHCTVVPIDKGGMFAVVQNGVLVTIRYRRPPRRLSGR